MKDIKVGMIGALDMLKFKNLGENRLNVINRGSTKPLPNSYTSNEVAKLLHPKVQNVIIKDIIEENVNVKTFILTPDKNYNTSNLAFFKAGQYVTITKKINGAIITRAYSLSSSPFEAKKGIYSITIKRCPNGIFSNYMLDEADIGDTFELSEPSGFLTYSSLRDKENIVALAAGTGITPFISMAKAVAEGNENFNLTILYAVNNEKDILFKSTLDKISKAYNKIRIIYILRDEIKENFEHGLITANLILNYTKGITTNYSVYAAGPIGFITYMSEESKKLNLPSKLIRFEKSPYNQSFQDNKVYSITVNLEDTIYTVPCSANEKILSSLERAGIKAPSKCQVGGCGYCRSKLLSGKIYSLKEQSLKLADEKFDYFHPCCSYPRSDLSIRIYKV